MPKPYEREALYAANTDALPVNAEEQDVGKGVAGKPDMREQADVRDSRI